MHLFLCPSPLAAKGANVEGSATGMGYYVFSTHIVMATTSPGHQATRSWRCCHVMAATSLGRQVMAISSPGHGNIIPRLWHYHRQVITILSSGHGNIVARSCQYHRQVVANVVFAYVLSEITQRIEVQGEFACCYVSQCSLDTSLTGPDSSLVFC